MATASSADGALHLEPRSLPLRRFFSGVTIFWSAIREGRAANHDYHRLLNRGVPHDEAVQRVFDEHFGGR